MIKLVSKSENEITFTVDEMDSATANALRRIMMSEVPTMAIEEVRIMNNNSVLFNEIIAHRLGLMPLKFDDKSDKTTLVLKKEGPCTVYSGDMVSTDKNVVPMYDNMPIVKLLENQRIDLEADTAWGTGQQHAKWQAAVVGYEQEKDKFTFTVESISGLSPKEIFAKALEILGKKADELQNAI